MSVRVQVCVCVRNLHRFCETWPMPCGHINKQLAYDSRVAEDHRTEEQGAYYGLHPA